MNLEMSSPRADASAQAKALAPRARGLSCPGWVGHDGPWLGTGGHHAVLGPPSHLAVHCLPTSPPCLLAPWKPLCQGSLCVTLLLSIPLARELGSASQSEKSRREGKAEAASPGQGRKGGRGRRCHHHRDQRDLSCWSWGRPAPGPPTWGTHTAPCSRARLGRDANRHRRCFSDLLGSSAFADTSAMLGWARRSLRLPPAALPALGRCLFLRKVLVEWCLQGNGGLLLFPTHRPSQTQLETVCPGDGQTFPAPAKCPEPGVHPLRAPLPCAGQSPAPAPHCLLHPKLMESVAIRMPQLRLPQIPATLYFPGWAGKSLKNQRSLRLCAARAGQHEGLLHGAVGPPFAAWAGNTPEPGSPSLLPFPGTKDTLLTFPSQTLLSQCNNHTSPNQALAK